MAHHHAKILTRAKLLSKLGKWFIYTSVVMWMLVFIEKFALKMGGA